MNMTGALSREEQLLVLSGVTAAFAMVWVVWARYVARNGQRQKKGGYIATSRVEGGPSRNTTNSLAAPLLPTTTTTTTQEEEGETDAYSTAQLVKSRVPLAARQGACYVFACFYLVAAAVYLARYFKGHGPAAENRARLMKAGADILRAFAWIVAARGDAAEYRSSRRARNTPALLAFVALSAVCAAREVKFSGKSFAKMTQAPSLWALTTHFFYALMGLHAFSARHLILRVADDEHPPSPEERAVELHEIVAFTWLAGVFEAKRKQGPDEKLDESHLPALMVGDAVDATYPRLKDLIAQMRRDAEAEKKKSPSKKITKFSRTLKLFLVLVTLAKDHFVAAGIIRVFYVASGYLQPLALYIILKRFGKDDALGWASVGMLFFGPVLNAVLDSMQMFVQRRVATRCRGALMVLIYDKGTRLDLSAGGGRVGDVVALLSADIQNILIAVAYFHWVWGPVLQLIITLAALFWLVKLAAFGALMIMGLNSLANGRLFKHLTKWNKQFLAARSKRMELITEMLQGARIIKMLSFEKGIYASVEKRRAYELSILKKLLDCFVGIFTLINSTPPLMGAATFMLMSGALNRRFDAAEGFTALTLLDNLRFVLLQAPASINYIITGWASLQRIEDMLSAPEVDDKPSDTSLPRGSVNIDDADFSWGKPPDGGGKGDDDDQDDDDNDASTTNPMHHHKGVSSEDEVKKADDDDDEATTVSAADVEAPLVNNPAEDKALPTLRDVALRVAPGSLVVVCGITGGGKSSLLSALVGEIRRLRGDVKVSGSTAYCPQSAWCQNATIRENIVFGSEFDEPRFQRCVDACALNADLDALPAGDATEVGERGVTLSGGQQQRVALARAVYHDADIYIFDDPLSAVDAHVAEHLFEHVVKRLLLSHGKTVILATHQISVALGRADHVVIMTTDGTIAVQGTLDAIQRTDRGRELFEELAKNEQQKGGAKKDSAKKQKKAADGDNAQPDTNKGKTPADSSSGNGAKEVTAATGSAGTLKGAGPGPKGSRDGRLVKEEERKTGAPASRVFALYVASAGFWFIFGSVLFVSQQPIKYVQSAALTRWIARMENGAEPLGTPAWIYLGWTAVFVFLSFVAVVAQNAGALRASKIIHERLSWRVLRCPIAWYDRSPVGRVQNRFSTDIQAIDRSVSNAVVFVIRGLISPLVSLYAIGTRVWWLLPCFIPVLAAAFSVAVSYLHVARDLKRIDSTTKSPVFALFNESLNGLSTLRAFDGAVDRFKRKFAGLVDRTNSAELHLFAANFWLSVRLNALGATVTGLTALVLYAQAAAGHGGLSAPFAGLVLSYAVSFTSAMIMLLRTYTDLEISLNSVERVQEYLDLPIEPELELPNDDPRWLVETPAEVAFQSVTLRYKNQPEPALRSLSMVVRTGESLGVCGRTGAGKSTLLQSLLRLYPLEAGRVVIDGVDIATVGLKTLRGRVAIVPQEPTLFAGSLRYNLDMFGERSDEELLDALEQSRGGSLARSGSSSNLLGASSGSLASLGAASGEADADAPASEGVAELSLDFELHEFGTNLSVGERQLVCLARAIARKSSLVLLDEATANVDQKTDARVQTILRSGSLSKATRITIAHRLKTIVYCDRVCVLSLGELKELDAPSRLLADKTSMFYSMCEASGSLSTLQAQAKSADEQRAAA